MIPPQRLSDKQYEAIERVAAKLSPPRAIAVGLFLNSIMVFSYFFNIIEISKHVYIRGADLIFTYNLISSSIILGSFLAMVGILFLSHSTDKFRYALILTLVLFFSNFYGVLSEIPNHFPSMPNPEVAGTQLGNLMFLVAILPLISMAVFGLQAARMPAGNLFFKWCAKLNAKLQEGYDRDCLHEKNYLEGKESPDAPWYLSKKSDKWARFLLAVVLFVLIAAAIYR